MPAPTETKQRILDAAERLISEQGYAATSLRQIISEAGVNLASVHYHFGSKDELLDELVRRKAGPVNERRMHMLAEFERAAGGLPVPVDQVLIAFLEPPFQQREQSPQFVRLMGRMYGEGLMPALIRKHFQPMVARFYGALRRALPELPEEELMWRIHFLIGATAHTMFGPPENCSQTITSECLLRRLVSFLAAALRAPVPATE